MGVAMIILDLLLGHCDSFRNRRFESPLLDDSDNGNDNCLVGVR